MRMLLFNIDLEGRCEASFILAKSTETSLSLFKTRIVQ